MTDKISLSDFTQLVELAEIKYPNATVMSVGSGCRDGEWYYLILLEYDGKEIVYEIPCYLEEN